MRALTITQPFASLIAIGAKRIETRSWPTTYRGPLAIHAAKGLGPVGGPAGLLKLCDSEPFASALADAALTAESLPLGAIVCTARLTDCVPMTARRVAGVNGTERAFGVWSLGRHAWHLDRVCRLTPPVEDVRGALSLWEPTRGVRAAIRSRAIDSRTRRAYAALPAYHPSSYTRDGAW